MGVLAGMLFNIGLEVRSRYSKGGKVDRARRTKVFTFSVLP